MKKQFKLYLEEDEVQRMEELAEKYGIKSANFVAQEVLYEFTDFWVQLQEVKANEKKRLMNALLLKDSPKRRTG